MKKKIFLIVVVIVCFCMTGCIEKEDVESIIMGMRTYTDHVEDDQNDYNKIADTLTELGITGITRDLVKQLEKYDADLPEDVIINKYSTMLASLGMADIDYDTWEQTPVNDSVYAFDVEIFNEGTMYSDFLRGIAAIGGGELDFSNIEEDTSQVDWEAGTGHRSVTFDWNGEIYTINAECNYDWFDFAAIDQLNAIIMDTRSSKHLYFTGDDYQNCILFYRTADWAEEFQEKTGLELWDKTQ